MVALERNTGGAGGFAAGIAQALTHDPDLVPLVDEVRHARTPPSEPQRSTPRAVLSACGPLSLFAAAAIPMRRCITSAA